MRVLFRCALFSAFVLLAFVATFPSSARAASGVPSVRLFGHDYIDARDFARQFGLTPQWVVPQKKLRLKSEWTTIDFTVHDADVILNRLRVFLSEPIVAHRGSLYLARRDADDLLAVILRPSSRRPAPRLKTIVIDAGHGGHDPGNQNPRLKLQEKQMTLDVAKRLERLLRAEGYRVVQTRTTDRYIDFDARVALIRKSRADLFISIHFNGFTDPSVAGTETYVLTPRHQRSSPQRERDRRMVTTAYPGNKHDHWNALLGYHMHRQLVEGLGRPDRGLKRFRYRVLREATCPAVLVEAAFLSNDTEGRQVGSAAYRQKIAASIAAGVKAHAAALRRIQS